MRISIRLAGTITALLLGVALWTIPVHATVHEIVAQWCSGQAPLNPPGLSREGSKNFAQPLNATGVVNITFSSTLGGLLVSFDYSHPATKVRSSGRIIQIGTTEDGTPVFLDVPAPDPDFPAFQHCPGV